MPRRPPQRASSRSSSKRSSRRQAPADGHGRAVEWADPAVAITAALEGRLSGLEFLRAMRDGEIPPPPLGVLLGFEIAEIEPGRVVFTLQPAEHHYNPNGVLHGGVAATLLDTVTGCAVTSMLPFGATCATLELKVNYIRSLTAKSPAVRAEGSVLHLGSRSAVAEGRIVLPDGKLVAHATSTLLLFAAGDRHGRRQQLPDLQESPEEP